VNDFKGEGLCEGQVFALGTEANEPAQVPVTDEEFLSVAD
jgi:hypothetical protein